MKEYAEIRTYREPTSLKHDLSSDESHEFGREMDCGGERIT